LGSGKKARLTSITKVITQGCVVSLMNLGFSQPLNALTVDKQVLSGVDLLCPLERILFATLCTPKESDFAIADKGGFYHKLIEFDNSKLMVLARHRFFNEMKGAISTGSKAKYLLWKEEPNLRTGWLIQYLPANAETSRHYHLGQTEVFNVLEGKVYLNLDGFDIEVSAGENKVVLPGSVHQLYTLDKPALTVLEMRNFAGSDGRFHANDHYYV